MNKIPLIIGIIALILSVVIFLYTSGSWRVHGSLILALVGIIQLIRAVSRK
ncbi:MAG: hypothetical protein GF417_00925 [Candidatus Latescibacteria bacterium]|nr:hypothetical protein [bacterium]MBD3422989.1 hypothetical protein [Candidatus Latescibacterota bacterium]